MTLDESYIHFLIKENRFCSEDPSSISMEHFKLQITNQVYHYNKHFSINWPKHRSFMTQLSIFKSLFISYISTYKHIIKFMDNLSMIDYLKVYVVVSERHIYEVTGQHWYPHTGLFDL